MSVLEKERAAGDNVPNHLRHWTREEYYKMGEAGIIRPDERVELIRGEVVTMAPIGPTHSSFTDPLRDLLVHVFGSGFTVRAQNPIVMSDDTEPEPDIAVVAGHWRDYLDHKPTPTDVRLIVEVSESSLADDRSTKMVMYAEAGIPEYWIINLVHRQVEVHQDPGTDGYRDRRVLKPGESLTALHAASRPIAVGDLLP